MAEPRNDPAFVAEQFYAAATGAVEWSDALTAVAALTGSFTGELLGFGRSNTLSFYCRNAIAPEIVEDFKAARGYDPAVNSRVRIGLKANPFDILDERDFTTALDMERNPEYGAYIRKIDGPYLCLASIVREQGMTVGLTVVRTSSQGNITDAQRRAFADVIPHVRSAVCTHLLFENRQMATVADTFERLSAPAFVCTSGGLLQALSATAEALLRRSDWLSVRDNVLVARTVGDTRRLHDALYAAATAGPARPAPPRPFAIHNETGDLLPLEAMPYVSGGGLRSADLAVLVAKPPRDLGEGAAQVARSLFQLTDKEVAISSELIRGRSVTEIAQVSGAAVGTVRVHLRNIFEKIDVNNQAQLIAKLCSYM